MLEATEDKIGLGLFIVGFIVLLLFGDAAGDDLGAIGNFIFYSVYTIISVVAGIAAAYSIAAVMDTSFGFVHSAVIRLSGIIVGTLAVSYTLPYGWLLSVIAYFALLMWMFEMDLFEVIVFVIVLWVMRLIVFVIVLWVMRLIVAVA